MSKYWSLTVSIGLFGGIDTYLTAAILPIPVWVTFIAWASFFACGGGSAGFIKSVLSNWTGIVIASLALLGIGTFGGSPLAAAICVGIGSACMILMTRFQVTSFPPAIVFGFASTVGTVAATGQSMTVISPHHPTFIAAVAVLVGASFGYVSEMLTEFLAKKPIPMADAMLEAPEGTR
jgi:Protein of unknown function (DUF1097)